MITKATFIIECDNCSEPNWDAMRFLGWTKAFGHDLCPSCSKEGDG